VGSVRASSTPLFDPPYSWCPANMGIICRPAPPFPMPALFYHHQSGQAIVNATTNFWVERADPVARMRVRKALAAYGPPARGVP